MSFREIAIFVPLIAWSIWIGVYPKPYFDVLRRPVAEIVQRSAGVLRGTQRWADPWSAPGPRPGLGACRRRPVSQYYTSMDHFTIVPA